MIAHGMLTAYGSSFWRTNNLFQSSPKPLTIFILQFRLLLHKMKVQLQVWIGNSLEIVFPHVMFMLREQQPVHACLSMEPKQDIGSLKTAFKCECGTQTACQSFWQVTMQAIEPIVDLKNAIERSHKCGTPKTPSTDQSNQSHGSVKGPQTWLTETHRARSGLLLPDFCQQCGWHHVDRGHIPYAQPRAYSSQNHAEAESHPHLPF